ncbi:MAG: hypothetical protein HZB17_05365 [Chloroflexi bacterium]|nr:hypothetical protein [Chloroflexota bacterium]
MTARRDWHDHYRANFRKWKMVFLKISFGVEGRERVAADAAESVERAITARARSETDNIALIFFTFDLRAARFCFIRLRITRQTDSRQATM